MNQSEIERLKKKYEGTGKTGASGGKEMQVGPRGGANRDRAMNSHGKPKNLKKTIVKIYKYLDKERALLFIAIISALLNTVFTLLGSYLLRPIINKYIYEGDGVALRIHGLGVALVWLGVVYGISVLTQWLQQRIMLTVSQRAVERMRKDLYSKILTLPVSYTDRKPVGDIMSRFTNDADTVGEMLNTTLIQLISGAITIVGTVFLMLYTNVILGMITIVMTPVLTLVSKKIIKHGRGAYSIQQKNLGILNGYSEEMISGQKVVKVFNYEETASEEFDYLNEELCESQIKAQFRAGIMGPVTHQLCNLIYAFTACVGAILIILGKFDYGGLTVSLNYTRHFNRPINEISMQMNTVFAALAGAERVFEVLESEPEKDDEDAVEPDEINGHVVLEHVNFGYIPGKPVLHDISLYAKPGQKIAFVGSTGAGKTTVTNLLSRFYDIDSGSITIDGMPIEKIKRGCLRKNIAMVLQDTHLFTGTVMENIRYGRPDATDEEVIAAAKVASAHSFIMQLENGYDTLLENDSANLSQGQRQLLNIARAAISKAPILILDEATSSVDTRTEKLIEKGMDNLMKDRTTFVIAHRLSTVRMANAIMVIEGGKIIERGDHEELVAAGGRYAELYKGISELID